MKFKRFFCILVNILLVLILPGCKLGSDRLLSDFKIITTCYPVYILTLNLTEGTGATVINLETSKDGCGHDVELSTTDMQNIESADVIILNGAGLESYSNDLYKMQENGKRFKIIDSSIDIDLIEFNGKNNPHIWLSLKDYCMQIDTISEKLKEFNPKNSDIYQHNAYYYKKKINDLKDEFSDLFECKENFLHIVTVHDSFAYFNRELYIRTVKVIENHSHNSINPQDVKDTIELIKNYGIKSIFVDSHYAEDSIVKTIVSESGAKLFLFDTNVYGEDDKNSYLNAMRKNFETLREVYKNE